MNCQNCGNLNKDSNKFCINCGAEIIVIENYYDVLGVPINASVDEIKRAYHLLAHQYHPDKNNGNEKRFKKINEAYRILSGKLTKREYDDGLRNKSNSDDYNKYSEKKSEPKKEKEGTKPNPKTEVEKEKNKYVNTVFAIVFPIVIVIIFFVTASYWGVNSSNDSSVSDKEETPVTDTKIDTSEYLTIGGGPTLKDDFSLNFSWMTAGEVLEKKEVSVVNEYYSYEEPRTNGMFAIAIISVLNNGKERKSVSLGDFSFVDTEGRIYKPYFTLDKMESTHDEKGKVVPIVPTSGDTYMSIQPGINEKRAIIFEIAKDIKSASLKFKYDNK